jgi:hypothetical protein
MPTLPFDRKLHRRSRPFCAPPHIAGRHVAEEGRSCGSCATNGTEPADRPLQEKCGGSRRKRPAEPTRSVDAVINKLTAAGQDSVSGTTVIFSTCVFFLNCSTPLSQR